MVSFQQYIRESTSLRRVFSVGEGLKGKVSAGDIPSAICVSLCCDKEYWRSATGTTSSLLLNVDSLRRILY